jgi:tryptophanyl-tRNA synthetase
MSKVLFSGIQPTGELHLGNLIGAIDLWKELQYKFDLSLFCIVDLHSITANHIHKPEHSLYTAALYIACGIDPEKSVIFLQSHIKEHTELCWLLSCITPIGWLNRMTQFKEKSSKNKEQSSLGLYSYPVLMAADILLYNTHSVPVGEDQTQHVELTRDIAKKFNETYNTNYFKLPEIITNKNFTRIMSIKDGKNKMSKSDPSENSRINLTDDPDTIAKKIKSAKTDSIVGFDLETLKDRPEANNLIKLLSYFTGNNVEKLCNDIKSFNELKTLLIDAITMKLKPMQEKMKLLDQTTVKKILKQSAEQAQLIAKQNINAIKNIMNFY